MHLVCGLRRLRRAPHALVPTTKSASTTAIGAYTICLQFVPLDSEAMLTCHFFLQPQKIGAVLKPGNSSAGGTDEIGVVTLLGDFGIDSTLSKVTDLCKPGPAETVQGTVDRGEAYLHVLR